MRQNEWTTLTRDVDGLLIPTAIPIALPSGTTVEIVQSLGGSYTVNVNGNLVRIESIDADALGKEEVLQTEVEKVKFAEGPVIEEDLWEQLKSCYDPEIPVNIVELGLIYDCQIEPDLKNKKNKILVTMTLTAPGCGMGPVIAEEVKSKISSVKNVTEVEVELVFDPPWSQDKMSEAAKLQLGFL
jgi:probable FeS assembly SUF system protein SufT